MDNISLQKKILFSVILAFGAIFTTLFIIEVFVRLFPNITGIHSTAYEASPAIYQNDIQRGYALLPGAVARHRSHSGMFDVTYRINAQGLRSSTVSYKDKAKKRILLLGDSFVFGHGVEDNETLAVRMENILNSKFSKMKYEIINAGVPGYSLDNEYMTLKALLYLKPDIVLLGICINDFYDLNFHKWDMDNRGDILRTTETKRYVNDRNHFAAGTKKVNSKKSYLNILKEFGRKYLFIYNFMGTFRYRNRDKSNTLFKSFMFNENLKDKSFDKSLKVIFLIKKLCEEIGAEFALFSVDNTVLAAYPKTQGGALGIPVFDVSELYNNYNLSFPHEMHWSPEGTIHVARWLINKLQNLGMILSTEHAF